MVERGMAGVTRMMPQVSEDSIESLIAGATKVIALTPAYFALFRHSVESGLPIFHGHAGFWPVLVGLAGLETLVASSSGLGATLRTFPDSFRQAATGRVMKGIGWMTLVGAMASNNALPGQPSGIWDAIWPNNPNPVQVGFEDAFMRGLTITTTAIRYGFEEGGQALADTYVTKIRGSDSTSQ